MSFTYCLIFAAGILVTSPHVPVYVGNYGVSVQGQLGLEGGVSGGQNGADRTYVEDLKDPNEVQLPGGDGFLVIFRMGKLGEQIPFLLLDDLYLDLCHSSAIDGVVSEAHIHHYSSSRCQLFNRLTHGPIQLIQPPSAHPAVKGTAYIRTGEPEFDAFQFVGHGVLDTYEPG